MCIENDIRGNIKLSLKATLPQHGSQRKKFESQGSPATTSEEGTGEAPISRNQSEVDDKDSSICSIPSVVIRSAAECDAQDISLGQKTDLRPGKDPKNSPRPYNSLRLQRNVEKYPGSGNSRSSKKNKETTVTNSSMQESDKVDALFSVLTKKDVKPKTDSTTKLHAGSLTLGQRVTAKVHQIRAHGLVIELGGGLRGMYKFEVSSQHFFNFLWILPCV